MMVAVKDGLIVEFRLGLFAAREGDGGSKSSLGQGSVQYRLMALRLLYM